ncbi:MAG TPA: hypothetical protein VIV06_12655 [Candidatus Limnocylindrales bacterium]
MNSAIKIALAAAAVVAAVVAGISFLPGSPGGVGGPGAVSPSPVVSPSPTPRPSHQVLQMTVAGTEVNGSSLQLTAQLPEGWSIGASGPNGAYAVQGSAAGPPAGIAFFVSLVDNTFSDPCQHVERSPKIGSTVEALATALGEIPDTTATAPVQATIAGRPATYIELTIPASLPCAPEQFYLWQDSPGGDWWALGPNEVIRVWILDVGSQRVAIAARSYPGTSDAAKAELQGSLDSIVFDGASTQPGTTPAAS